MKIMLKYTLAAVAVLFFALGADAGKKWVECANWEELNQALKKGYDAKLTNDIAQILLNVASRKAVIDISRHTVTLDLNGHTITCLNEDGNADLRLFCLRSSIDDEPDGDNYIPSNFTLMDSSPGKTGVIRGCPEITRGFDGGCVFVEDGCSFTFTGGTIKNFKVKRGGGVAGAGTIILDGGTITDCVSTNNGGGVYGYIGGRVYLKSGTIKNCTAAGAGGGVCARGRFVMTGGEVINNTSTTTENHAGGGVYISSDVEARIYGGLIAHNTAGSGKKGGGGGICCKTGALAIYGCCVTNNFAGNYGGGIAVTDGGRLTLYGALVKGNTYGSKAPCVYTGNGRIVVYGGEYDVQPSSFTSSKYVKLATGYDEKLVNGIYVVGKGSADDITVTSDNKLTGGTYTFDPSDYATCGGVPVAAGKVVYATATIPKTYTIADSKPSAPTYAPTTVSCNTWDAMKTALESGNHVTLTGNVAGPATARTQVELSNLQNVTLDLNGHTVTCSTASRFINIGEGATFTLKDSVGTGAVTGGTGVKRSADFAAAPVSMLENGGCVSVDGIFVLEGGTIRDCNVSSGSGVGNAFGGGVYVSPSGSFVFAGGTITNCSARSGGGAFIDGSFSMTGGTVTACSAVGETSFTGGGGIMIGGGDNTTITGGAVLNNTSAGFGGGLGNLDGTPVIYGCEIRGNHADKQGGAFSTCSGIVSIYGALVRGNTADTHRCFSAGEDTGSDAYERGTILIYGGEFDQKPSEMFYSSSKYRIRFGKIIEGYINYGNYPDRALHELTAKVGGTELTVVGTRLSLDAEDKLSTAQLTFDPFQEPYATLGIPIASGRTPYEREGHVHVGRVACPKTWTLVGAGIPILVQPPLYAHTTMEVYTNGVRSSIVEPQRLDWFGSDVPPKWAAWSNEEAYVVYTVCVPDATIRELDYVTSYGLCMTVDVNTCEFGSGRDAYDMHRYVLAPTVFIETDSAFETHWNPMALPNNLQNWIYDLTYDTRWTNASGLCSHTVMNPKLMRFNWILGTNVLPTINQVYYEDDSRLEKNVYFTNEWDKVNNKLVAETRGRFSDTPLERIEADAKKKAQTLGLTPGVKVASDADAEAVLPVLTEAFCGLTRTHEATDYEGRSGMNGFFFSNLCAQVGRRYKKRGGFQDNVLGNDLYFPNKNSRYCAGGRLDAYTFGSECSPRLWFTNMTWTIDEAFRRTADYYGAGVTNSIAFLDQIPDDWTGTCLLPGCDNAEAKAAGMEWKCFDNDVSVDRGDVLLMKALCHMSTVLLQLGKGYHWAGDKGKSGDDLTELKQVQQVHDNMFKILHLPIREWSGVNQEGMYGRSHKYIDMMYLTDPWYHDRYGERIERAFHDFFHLTPTMFDHIDDTNAMNVARASFREALRCYLDADAFIFDRKTSKTGTTIVGHRDTDEVHLLELTECEDPNKGSAWNASGWRYVAEQLWESMTNAPGVGTELDLPLLAKTLDIHARPTRDPSTSTQQIDFSGLGRNHDGKLAFNAHALFDGGLTRTLVRDVDGAIEDIWNTSEMLYCTGRVVHVKEDGTYDQTSFATDIPVFNYVIKEYLHPQGLPRDYPLAFTNLPPEGLEITNYTDSKRLRIEIGKPGEPGYNIELYDNSNLLVDYAHVWPDGTVEYRAQTDRVRLKLNLGDATLSETLGGLLPDATLLDDLITMTNRYPVSNARFSGFAKRLSVTPPTMVPTPEIQNTTRKVYDRFGDLAADGCVRTNLAAKAVYTALPGYVFADGTTEKTVDLDTSVSPAKSLSALPKAVQKFEYLAPVYKGTDNSPTNGIAYWKTNEVYTYTVVTSATSAVTWGTAGTTNWFVVTNGTYRIDGGVMCEGHVNLILCNGAKLMVTNAADNAAGIATDVNGAFAVYAQSVDATSSLTPGELYVYGGKDAAGIGGNYDTDGCNITLNGGTVVAMAFNCGAGIGGGEQGDGVGIVINGGTVMATGGHEGAGIGGGYKAAGSRIVINGGQVTARGAIGGAGIGGGCVGEGFDILINGGDVTAVGSVFSSAIGGGQDRTGYNIALNGGVIRVATPVIGSEGNLCAGDLVGNCYDVGYCDPASNVVLSATAKVLFNLTGKVNAAGEWIVPLAPMLKDFVNGTIMTPGTQEVSRVLVGGCGGLIEAALPSFMLTNVVTGATLVADLGKTNSFASKFCCVESADDKLVLKALPPTLTITQQPALENGYAIRAETNGDGNILKYSWYKSSTETVDFHSLTNKMMDEFDATFSGTNVLSVGEDVQVVALQWSVGTLPAGGVFRFRCTSELGDRFALILGIESCKLTRSGDDWVLEPIPIPGDDIVTVCVYNKDSAATSFTLENFRYTAPSVEYVDEGVTMKTFPADKGEEGVDYFCRITHAHAGIPYTGDSETFTYVPVPSEPILAQPTPVAHATVSVYTNEVLSTETSSGSGLWNAWSNQTATVVYTATPGYYFADGTTVKTNELDTTKNPADVKGTLPAAPAEPSVMVGKPVQRYPWNGIVDVPYRVKNAPAGGAALKFTVTVGATGYKGGMTILSAGGRVEGVHAIDFRKLGLEQPCGEAKVKATFVFE